MKFKLFMSTVILLVFVSGMAIAEENNTNQKWVKPGWVLNNSIGASINALGFAITTEFFYKMPFVKKNGILWESTHLGFGIVNSWTPSYDTIGAMLLFEPIAVFDIEVKALYDIQYAGITGGLFPLANANTDHSSDARKITTPTPDSYGGLRLIITPTLKVAFGPIAIVHSFTYMYLNYTKNGTAITGVIYDANLDDAILATDSALINDSKILFQVKDFRFGVSYNTVHIIGTAVTKDTLAGIIVYTPSKWAPKNFTPYGVLLIGSHFQDQQEKGELYVGGLFGLSIKFDSKK